ncbi:MAG: IS30 family transposase [Rhodothermales bacterium]
MHITYEERFYIEARLGKKESINSIARDLKRSASSISREIRNNTDPSFGFYSAKQAQALSEQRSKSATRKPQLLPHLPDETQQFIRQSLSERCSPEQICGRVALEFETKISHQTLYRHIWKDRAGGGNLYKSLRRRGKKIKGSVSNAAAKIANKICISQRCEAANEKSEAGHWEIDTVFGLKQQSYLLTLVDRCTKYTVIRKLDNKCADTVQLALQDVIENTLLPFKSLTSDNGSEFAYHTKITKRYDLPFYFARAYSSWERGLNEHTNGLIRDYLPKRTDFRAIDESEIQTIENTLNNRPRKVLKFATPKEALVHQLEEAA